LFSSALQTASRCNNAPAVHALVAAGANLEAPGAEKLTPLQVRECTGDRSCLYLFLPSLQTHLFPFPL
jgi:hypothetical protein